MGACMRDASGVLHVKARHARLVVYPRNDEQTCVLCMRSHMAHVLTPCPDAQIPTIAALAYHKCTGRQPMPPNQVSLRLHKGSQSRATLCVLLCFASIR